MSILEKITKIRKQKKISRKEMGESLFISDSTYRDIEIGKIRLSLDNFFLICKKLEINPYELINESNQEHFVLLNDRDINDLNRIISKINNQTFAIANLKSNDSINADDIKEK